jgi:hypothetical protein
MLRAYQHLRLTKYTEHELVMCLSIYLHIYSIVHSSHVVV